MDKSEETQLCIRPMTALKRRGGQGTNFKEQDI